MDLEKDLFKYFAEYPESLNSEHFCELLYAALCNVVWSKEGQDWSCSWRYAGGLVASLRNAFCSEGVDKETYLDWYCAGREGYIDAKIKGLLEILGWEGRNA